MTMPGFAAKANRDLVDRVASIELAIRNMQKTPRNAPVTTDYHLYGDQVSTGPRYMVSGVSWGTTGTGGQLYTQYLGQMPTDMVFSTMSLYVQTVNGATATLGLYTGQALNAMTLQSEITVSMANSAVSGVTYPAPISVPRETFVIAGLRMNTGATAPVFGALSPSGGGLPGLTVAGAGFGCARYNTTGLVAQPSTLDATTGFTGVSSSLWISLS